MAIFSKNEELALILVSRALETWQKKVAKPMSSVHFFGTVVAP